MTTKSEKKRFTSYLEPQLHKGLRDLNNRTHVPITAYINEAIADLLKKHGQKIEK